MFPENSIIIAGSNGLKTIYSTIDSDNQEKVMEGLLKPKPLPSIEAWQNCENDKTTFEVDVMMYVPTLWVFENEIAGRTQLKSKYDKRYVLRNQIDSDGNTIEVSQFIFTAGKKGKLVESTTQNAIVQVKVLNQQHGRQAWKPMPTKLFMVDGVYYYTMKPSVKIVKETPPQSGLELLEATKKKIAKMTAIQKKAYNEGNKEQKEALLLEIA